MVHLSCLTNLALFEQINLALLFFFLSLCVLVCLIGAITRSGDSIPSTSSHHGFPLLPDYVIAFTICTLLVFNIIAAALIPAPGATEQESWLNILFTLVFFSPIVIRLFFARHTKTVVKLGFWRSSGLIALGLISANILGQLVDLSGLMDVLVQVCGSPQEQEVVTEMGGDNWMEQLPLICSAVLVMPVLEECLFRGMIYPCVRRFSSPIFAAVASGCLFGAVHMALPQMIPLSFLGIFLCYLYERTQSIFLPIILHIVFNSVTVLLIYIVLPRLEKMGLLEEQAAALLPQLSLF